MLRQAPRTSQLALAWEGERPSSSSLLLEGVAGWGGVAWCGVVLVLVVVFVMVIMVMVVMVVSGGGNGGGANPSESLAENMPVSARGIGGGMRGMPLRLRDTCLGGSLGVICLWLEWVSFREGRGWDWE